MGRDHRNLVVFSLADRLVIEIYRVSTAFPTSERFGLQMQLRKATVSTASNIVEGCARRTTKEYLNFLNIAAASAAEVAYLAQLATRLGFLRPADGTPLSASYSELVAKLNALMNSLEREP
jgi:four helix bundle protein